MLKRHSLLALCVMLPLIMAVPVARADLLDGEPEWFAETQHTLGYVFREFYDRHGGLPIFGYPITEVFAEDGRPVQYFERARFEWHADLGLVLAGQLGRWAAEQEMEQPAFQPVTAPADGDFFVETSHSLRGEFRTYWQNQGGLPAFGYPLSEAFTALNLEDGREYTVQYFERARFELHPDLPAPYRVLLGQLGRRYLPVTPRRVGRCNPSRILTPPGQLFARHT